jgi:hypothetical protein
VIFSLVELEDGTQEFFDSPYFAFLFAKIHEDASTNSVSYVAVGDFWNDVGMVYRGQELRYLLRAIDNTKSWLKDSSEEDTDIHLMGG